MVDILAYIASALPSTREMAAFELAGRSLLESPIVNVINFSKKDPIVPLAQDHSICDALPSFAKGTHRVLLFDDAKTLSGLVSQSDFIRLLHTHFAKGDLKFVDFNFEKKFRTRSSVETILPTDTVLQAIGKLGSSVLRTLAIVDSNGLLIGNFSTTDVGYAFAVESARQGDDVKKTDLLQAIFRHLQMSIQDYLAKFHPKSLTPQAALPAITLEQICQIMAESNIKQVWITNDMKAKAPIGVITQTDVCRCIAEMCC